MTAPVPTDKALIQASHVSDGTVVTAPTTPVTPTPSTTPKTEEKPSTSETVTPTVPADQVSRPSSDTSAGIPSGAGLGRHLQHRVTPSPGPLSQDGKSHQPQGQVAPAVPTDRSQQTRYRAGAGHVRRDTVLTPLCINHDSIQQQTGEGHLHLGR